LVERRKGELIVKQANIKAQQETPVAAAGKKKQS
jgi:hypothetical protein